MLKLTIDNQEVSVPAGTTILQAARKLKIQIPTLCWAEELEPNVSCMLCAVQVAGQKRLVASCATPVAEGMEVATDTAPVLENRRLVLELLFSHHTGDCDAPCTIACPAGLDIPRLLRHQQQGDTGAAACLVLSALVLPRSLGCICPAPCEKACRRRLHDGAVAIPALHRTAATAEPTADTAPAVASGKRVAVIGSGPAGLAAAFSLHHLGHAVDLFDRHELAGGMLRYGVDPERLPRAVLEADLAVLLSAPIHFRAQAPIEDDSDFRELQSTFDAIIIASGAGSQPERWGLQTGAHGLVVDRLTQATSLPGVFAAGGVIREIKQMAVRAVASGKAAAAMADRYLR